MPASENAFEPAPQPPATAFSSLRWQPLAVLGLLIVVTVVVYLPALEGGTIWDDDGHITKPELRSAEGLRRIWFELGATQQYYPLLHSAFWLEYQLWGGRTLGYHVVNVLLHATAAWFVWLILCRLKIPGALLAAAIFALHPVQVESVAWISEQKNTLSAVFYLSAMLAYLHFDESRRPRFYALALMLFVLGLLAKTVTATLPAALLVIFWWQRGRLEWRRDIQPLVPFFLLGAVAGLLTAWVERNLIGAEGAAFQMSLVQRGLLAGRAPWFYLSKLLWPANLIFVYLRWELSPTVWWQWLFPLATLAVLVALVALRHRTRAPLAGWLLFVGTLFPVLGFFNVYPFLYSFVADHFQYLASLGIIVLVAAGFTLGLQRLLPAARWERGAMGVVLVGLLAYLTFQQSRMYSDIETLYRTTIAKNPTCWMAHYNLGILLGQSGRSQEAIDSYHEALEYKPDLAHAHNNLGMQLANAGRTQEAIDQYRRAIQSAAEYPEPHNNLGLMLLAAGRTDEAIEHFQEAIRLRPEFAEAYSNLGSALMEAGKSREAILKCREAVSMEPGSANLHYNLGVALAKAGRFQEAIGQFEETTLLQPRHVQAYTSIMTAYAKSQRPAKAIAAARRAVQAAQDAGQPALAQEIEAWLTNYRAGLQNSPKTTP